MNLKLNFIRSVVNTFEDQNHADIHQNLFQQLKNVVQVKWFGAIRHDGISVLLRYNSTVDQYKYTVRSKYFDKL